MRTALPFQGVLSARNCLFLEREPTPAPKPTCKRRSIFIDVYFRPILTSARLKSADHRAMLRTLLSQRVLLQRCSERTSAKEPSVVSNDSPLFIGRTYCTRIFGKQTSNTLSNQRWKSQGDSGRMANVPPYSEVLHSISFQNLLVGRMASPCLALIGIVGLSHPLENILGPSLEIARLPKLIAFKDTLSRLHCRPNLIIYSHYTNSHITSSLFVRLTSFLFHLNPINL